MELASQSAQLLGTKVEIQLPKQHASLFSECFLEMGRIERAYSRFLPGSELSRLNSHLGRWQDASCEFISLLSQAEDFRKETGGNFDITIKAALDSLGYDANYSFVPRPKAGPGLLGLARGLAGSIQLDRKRGMVLLNREIDFGGFGKGFALDKVRCLIEAHGVSHYYVNAGGDIFARRGEGEAPWEILLEHPDDVSVAIGKIPIDNCSIAASAPNRRKWGDFHHLLDARTGKPATGVKAVFAIAKSGIAADAYATALFTAGFEQGIALSGKLPVEVLIISSQGKMFRSKGFKAEMFG